jgi:hypothetical protein
LRTAFVFDADAFVVYVVEKDQDRILYIGKEPPAGLDFPAPD